MSAQFEPVTIPHSEVRLLESSIVDETYKLSIGLPADYGESDARYPVVYATPGFPDFYFLWPIARSMTVSEELPPLIIVGIGYQSDDPADIIERRLRDHMPTPAQEMDQAIMEFLELDSLESGKADRFLRFIRNELKPFVNANYRTRPDESTYAGFSSAGLFGLYVLFNQPETFKGYILGSPPIFRANKAILADERDYAARHDDLAARIFLSVGGCEETDDPFSVIQPSHHFVSNVEELARRLGKRNYPGLDLTTEIFEGETHLSVTPASYSRGLRKVIK